MFIEQMLKLRVFRARAHRLPGAHPFVDTLANRPGVHRVPWAETAKSYGYQGQTSSVRITLETGLVS